MFWSSRDQGLGVRKQSLLLRMGLIPSLFAVLSCGIQQEQETFEDEDKLPLAVLFNPSAQIMTASNSYWCLSVLAKEPTLGLT